MANTEALTKELREIDGVMYVDVTEDDDLGDRVMVEFNVEQWTIASVLSAFRRHNFTVGVYEDIGGSAHVGEKRMLATYDPNDERTAWDE